ncbi:MAG: 16S rRNA (cytidine(1402)-2'-O)-methyltransferase [Parachlamydiaceae bacterium]|nr:16S rRNA (cytidine(1402)-2'-O)-methyltransferase [Parachlamydiaceae bacterium]
MLYLVATPIGNLSDITLRAIETLKSSDYILCEDTRHSLILLKHYDIHKPLKSYHKFNESSQAEHIIQDLKDGQNISLISDAGTPGISDPGAALVNICVEQKIPITAIPGPCAAIQALSCSGLFTDRFQFWGFLPRKEGEIKRDLQQILSYSGTTICYESPNRLIDILEHIQQIDPNRQLVVARELTKKFEEVFRGTPSEHLIHWGTTAPRGEIVLLISAAPEKNNEWIHLTPEEHVEFIQNTYSISRQEAIKIAADLRGVPKRQIYNLIQKKE